MSINVPVVDEKEVSSLFNERKPFVLRGYDIGSCIDKWTNNYLADAVGKEEVKIHVSESPLLDFLQKNFVYKSLPFDEFLSRAAKTLHDEDHYFISKTEYYYLRSVGKDPRKEVANFKQQYPSLAQDLILPNFVPEEHIFSTIFRVASAKVSIWTHYDVVDNALIQIKGCKRAILFPPTDALNLYLNGDKSEVLDIDSPDLSRFPKFKDVTKYECCLLPGDILYIPALWFHNMKYLDFGIAVNVFWKELDYSLYDKKDPYGNKDHLPAQQAFNAVDKALASLSKLPKSYKEFYCLRLIAHIQKKMK